MDKFRTGVLALLTLTVALAGCSGGGDESGFSVSAPADPMTEPYVFTASGSADVFSWDFGDGTARMEGKTVEHVYGISSGTLTVTLTKTVAGEETKDRKEIVIGDGTNTAPSFALGASAEWIVTGETVTISGAGSSDPDGDKLLFSWACIFQGELQEAGGAHAHGDGGGVPFVGPQTSAVEPTFGGEMPAADVTVQGDLCDNIRGDGAFSGAMTIEGSFENPGLYRILMLAKDPANPSISAFLDLFVSAPEDKPEPMFNETFSGTFQGGGGGGGQNLCDTAAPGTVCDRAAHTFKLELPANLLQIDLSFDSGVGNQVSWTLYKGNKALHAASDSATLEDPTTYVAGDYRLEVVLDQGAQVGYEITVSGEYDMDPHNKYETGH